MLSDDLPSLWAYNRWADRRVLDACRSLTPEQYASEPVPGWSSVRSTVAHIALVTDGWLLGLAGRAAEPFPTEADVPDVDAALRLLDHADATFQELAAGFTPEWLNTPKLLQRGARKAILPPWVVIRHLVNHATYHRGQVASKLKRLGVEQPATDLVYWAFEQVPQNV